MVCGHTRLPFHHQPQVSSRWSPLFCVQATSHRSWARIITGCPRTVSAFERMASVKWLCMKGYWCSMSDLLTNSSDLILMASGLLALAQVVIRLRRFVGMATMPHRHHGAQPRQALLTTRSVHMRTPSRRGCTPRDGLQIEQYSHLNAGYGDVQREICIQYCSRSLSTGRIIRTTHLSVCYKWLSMTLARSCLRRLETGMIGLPRERIAQQPNSNSVVVDAGTRATVAS
mmetsp:Transcript_21004/g.53740  ORF Transcript_21004/g.53740 Transcript_21004/m.53740 type:complete len:229 (+) Transcript_21004:440-1126(+)